MAIKREVEVTAKANELFRMQSFATQLLFKVARLPHTSHSRPQVFFDEARGGMTYFRKTVFKVLDALNERRPEQLEVVPNGLSVSVLPPNSFFRSVSRYVKQRIICDSCLMLLAI